MEYVSLFEALAAEDMYPYDLFTVRSPGNRDRIKAWGLMGALPGQDATPETAPQGVYAFKNIEGAQSMATSTSGDIWKIPANTISNNLIQGVADLMYKNMGGAVVIGMDNVPNVEFVSGAEDEGRSPDWNKRTDPGLATQSEDEINVMNQGPENVYDLGNPDPVNKNKQYEKLKSPLPPGF
jgi:hypothetical protein